MVVIQIVILTISGLPSLALLGIGVLPARFGITNVINIVCYMLTTPISASFMALAYSHFFGRDQIDVFD